jgi:hypothetical protein
VSNDNVVKECQNCECVKLGTCSRYMDPSKFQRQDGRFMCPSFRIHVEAEPKQGKVRVGQQKQSKRG